MAVETEKSISSASPNKTRNGPIQKNATALAYSKTVKQSKEKSRSSAQVLPGTSTLTSLHRH